jgi:hypothetical protein
MTWVDPRLRGDLLQLGNCQAAALCTRSGLQALEVRRPLENEADLLVTVPPSMFGRHNDQKTTGQMAPLPSGQGLEVSAPS